jgi:hypothetical protein
MPCRQYQRFERTYCINLQGFLLPWKWDASYSTDINKYIPDYTVSHRAVGIQFESQPGHWLPWRAYFLVMKVLIVQFSLSVPFHLSSVQIFPSASCFQTPSVCVPPLMSDTKFHTHTKLEEKLKSIYFNFYPFRQQTRRQQLMDWMVASITRVQSALNFLLNHILICYSRFQVFEPCHVFKGSIIYLYVLIKSRDSSVRIATGYGLDCRGSISDRGKIILFSRPDLGYTQAPIQKIPGVKQSGSEADHSVSSSAEVKNGVPPRPQTSSWHEAQGRVYVRYDLALCSGGDTTVLQVLRFSLWWLWIVISSGI